MEVTLNRNGWHRQLQRFIFTDPPRFNSLCPYFWLTVYCIFALPFVGVVKLLIFGFVKLWRFLEATLIWLDEKVCSPLLVEFIKHLPEDEVVKGWAAYENYNRDRSLDEMEERERADFYLFSRDMIGNSYTSKDKLKLNERFRLWKQNTPDWEKKIAEIRERQRKVFEDKWRLQEESWKEKGEREQRKKERERQKEVERQTNAETIEAARKKRQQMFNKIVKYTSYIVPILLGCFAIFVLYWLGIFIAYVWTHFQVRWDIVGTILKWIGVTITCLAAGGSIIYLLAKLIQKCTLPATALPVLGKIILPFIWFYEYLLEPLYFKILQPFFSWIGSWLKIIVVGIGEGTIMFFGYLKSTKNNYCPAINWSDDDQQNA